MLEARKELLRDVVTTQRIFETEVELVRLRYLMITLGKAVAGFVSTPAKGVDLAKHLNTEMSICTCLRIPSGRITLFALPEHASLVL